MKEHTILKKYPAGHSYSYTMRQTNHYCPNCGKQTVWEDDQFDHNVENTFYCLSCITTWCMPFFRISPDSEDIQIIHALKTILETEKENPK